MTSLLPNPPRSPPWWTSLSHHYQRPGYRERHPSGLWPHRFAQDTTELAVATSCSRSEEDPKHWLG